jgi:hypothetical protein
MPSEPRYPHLSDHINLAAILCTEGLDVIRKEAWSFYRTISGVRLCWELEEPKGPKGRALSQVKLVWQTQPRWGRGVPWARRPH